jgi:hypothetical protein
MEGILFGPGHGAVHMDEDVLDFLGEKVSLID